MSETTIATLRLGQRNRTLEAKVIEIDFKKCPRHEGDSVLLHDKENNAIQASMDINNIHHFNLLLRLDNV
ncbi:hypothetical protein Tco_0016135 [Tanacetum coccineum]